MEKTIILTGGAYTDLKKRLASGSTAELSIGTEDNPKVVEVEEAYPDTDPDFAADAGKYPEIDANAEIQVRIKYRESR